jgi:hypothetical protein
VGDTGPVQSGLMGGGAPMCMRAGSDSACLLGTPQGDKAQELLSGAPCRCHAGRARLILHARMRVIAAVPCQHRGPARAAQAAGCATSGDGAVGPESRARALTGVKMNETARERPRWLCPSPAASLRASEVHQAMDGSPAGRMTRASGSEQPAGAMLTRQAMCGPVCGPQPLSVWPRECGRGLTSGESLLESGRAGTGPPWGIHNGGGTGSRAPPM